MEWTELLSIYLSADRSLPRQLVESEEWCSELEVCAKCRTVSAIMISVSLEASFLMQLVYLQVDLIQLSEVNYYIVAKQQNVML